MSLFNMGILFSTLFNIVNIIVNKDIKTVVGVILGLLLLVFLILGHIFLLFCMLGNFLLAVNFTLLSVEFCVCVYSFCCLLNTELCFGTQLCYLEII